MKKNNKNINKNKKKEQPRTFKQKLDKMLKFAVAALVLTAVVLFIVGAAQDNMTLMIVGTAMLPGTGILITPNIVLYAFKDNKGWKGKFRETHDRLYKEGMLGSVDDMSPYQNKLLWGVRREALWNLFKLTVLLAGILAGSYLIVVNGESGSDEFLSFLVVIGILTFGIPTMSYNIACSAHRIRTVKRCKYNAYHAVASGADGLYMWIMGKNEAIHSFDYCRCLGIRAKKIHNTNVILVFVPDEVYLIPDKDLL